MMLYHPESAKADSFGSFSVKAIIPENQINKNLSYFDLRLSPLETQTIQILVTNSSKEPIVAHLALNAAATGSNGVIIYSRSDIRDESLITSIDDVAKLETPEVEVAAESSVYVNIDIQMPEDSFDGVILGGIVVTANPEKKETATDESTQSVQIVNEYAYTIGLKISENDNYVKPNLNLTSIQPELVNYHTSIIAGIQNDQPIIMSQMSISGEIYTQNASELLYEAALNPASMAPNSTLGFVIDCGNQTLEPGIYRLKLKALWENDEWEWDQEFKITATEASLINEEAVGQVSNTNHSYWLIVLLIIFLIAAIAIIAYLIGRKRRQKKDSRSNDRR